MSAEPLSDDLSGWPTDPFEVLGLPHHAHAKAVKRAYTQLLRRFKPEHSPQHFQRLRAAYESAAQLAAWREQFQASEENDEAASTAPSEAELDSSHVPESHSEVVPVDEAEAAPPSPWRVVRSSPPIDPVEVAWREACNAQVPEAYRRLVAWHEDRQCTAGPTMARGYAQLYWLLTLYPELAPDSAASDWLAQGLTLCPDDWQLLELFRREVGREPHEGFRPAVEAMLASLPPGKLAQVLPIRWRAAQELDSETILQELNHYRPRIAYDDPAAWGRLLVAGLEHCVLSSPGSDALQPMIRELESITFAQQLGSQLDRLDLLLNVADQWPELTRSKTPRRWLRLLRECYTKSEAENDLLLAEIVTDMAAYPIGSLHCLDRLEKDHPLAALIFREQLEGYCRRRGAGLDDDEELVGELSLPPQLCRAIQQFRMYEWVRNELVEWSLAEHLPLTQCVGLISTMTGIDLEDDIFQDRSYRLVFAAWRIFWGGI